MTNHLSPEEAFAAAAAEFDDGAARPGLLAMAEAQADGDPARTRATYLRLRAAQLSGVPPAGARPAPSSTPRPAVPPPAPEKTGVGVGAAIGIVAAVLLTLAVLAFLFLNPERDAEGDALADAVVEETNEATVEPVVVSVDCASTRRRVGGDGAGSLLGSAVGSLVDDPSMEATVTVRNAGAPGEVVVAVAAFSEVQGGALGREQTISMASGERRQLSFTFDPTPFSRGGACRAWAAPLGDALADFDAFVETYNAIPERRAEPQRPDPEPAPAEPEITEPEPAPLPQTQPPRTPQPVPDPSPADPPTGDASGGDGAPQGSP